MPVTNMTHPSEGSIELPEGFPEGSPTVSQLAYYRDLPSSNVAFSWPYSDSTDGIHYRFQPLAFNPAFLHLAQREAFTRAFFGLYEQRSMYDGLKATSYTPPTRDEEKPKQSYVRLIGEAILNSPEKKLVLSEIYKNIQTKYAYFRNRGSGWKNSIRHNLSLNDCFVKLGRSPNGKGHFWTISPQHYEEFLRGSSQQRKFQKKQAPKFCYCPGEAFPLSNRYFVDSSTTQPMFEKRLDIQESPQDIEIKQEKIATVQAADKPQENRPCRSRPFDVENLLAPHPTTRPASY